jgi:hypothetical protein
MWCFQYDPETKQQSLQWKTQNSPQPKKARMSWSQVMTMLVCFFNHGNVFRGKYPDSGLVSGFSTMMCKISQVPG